jgi:hypothetical protein
MTKKEDPAPKAPPTAPRTPLDVQFGPTPSPPGSRLKRSGK